MSLFRQIKLDTDGNTVKIDPSNNTVDIGTPTVDIGSPTVKIDGTTNTVKLDSSNNKVKLTDGTNDASIVSPSTSSTYAAWSTKGLRVLIGPTDIISNLPVIIDYDHHQLHEGEMFRWSVYVSSLGNGNSKDIRFTVPNITIPSGNTAVGLCPHFRWEIVAETACNAYIYEGTTFSNAGNTRTPVAMERNGTYTPKLTIGEDPTVDVLGTTLIWQGLLVGSKQSAGDTKAADAEFILKNNTSYLFRVTNGTNTNKVLIRFVWYEDLGT